MTAQERAVNRVWDKSYGIVKDWRWTPGRKEMQVDIANALLIERNTTLEEVAEAIEPMTGKQPADFIRSLKVAVEARKRPGVEP